MKTTLRFLKRRREGVILPMALIIVLVGSALIAAIFDLSIVFSRTTTFQRRPYLDHVTTAGYIESVKGAVVELNNARGTVIHGDGNRSHSSPINALSDLQITRNIPDVVSVDEDILRNGGQRVEVQVFDANFLATNVHITDDAELRDLPPSLTLTTDTTDDWKIRVKGTSHTISTGGAVEDDTIRARHFTHYGAYLIRVRLFNRLADGAEVLARTVEEAFYQIVR